MKKQAPRTTRTLPALSWQDVRTAGFESWRRWVCKWNSFPAPQSKGCGEPGAPEPGNSRGMFSDTQSSALSLLPVTGLPTLSYLPVPLCAIQRITDHQDRTLQVALHLTAPLYGIIPHRTSTGACIPLVMENSLLHRIHSILQIVWLRRVSFL